jgi:menaquinone-dependent protoporphyrinogen oxidase
VNVLMAYATKNGSTRQVADAITAAMRERSAQVTPRQAKTVRESVAGFDLVVLEARCTPDAGTATPTGSSDATAGSLPAYRWPVFGMGPRGDTEDAWQRSRA